MIVILSEVKDLLFLWLVVVEIKEVPVQILYGELP